MGDPFRTAREVRDEARRRAELRADLKRTLLRQPVVNARRLVAVVGWEYEQERRRALDALRRGDAAGWLTATVSFASLYLALRRMADECGNPDQDLWEALEPVLDFSWTDEQCAVRMVHAAFEEVRNAPDAAVLQAHLLLRDQRVPARIKNEVAVALTGLVAAKVSSNWIHVVKAEIAREGNDFLVVLFGEVFEALYQRGRGEGFRNVRANAINSLRRQHEKTQRELAPERRANTRDDYDGSLKESDGSGSISKAVDECADASLAAFEVRERRMQTYRENAAKMDAAKLSDNERQVFLMARTLQPVAIAEKTGRSREQVRQELFRARRKIRRIS